MPISNQKSRSFQLAAWSFGFCVFFIFLGIIGNVTVGDVHIEFKMVSSDIVLFLLSPCLSLYGFRRFTDYLHVKNTKEDTTLKE